MRAIMRKLLLTRGEGAGYPISNLFANGADGLDFAPLKVDGQYQENTGVTPADDPDEVIGFMPDRHSWAGASLTTILAAQAELCTGGDFSSSTGWTLPTGSTIAGGKLAIATVPQTLTYFTVSSQPAGSYRVEFTLSDFSAGDVVLRLYANAVNVSSNLATFRTANGTYVAIGQATAAFNRIVVNTGGAGFTGSIDNVSVKLVSGNHGIQATTGFKPKYQVAGAKFDATDDNELTTYLAQAGANCILAYVEVPATIAATQVIAGASGASANRIFLAFNTSGQLCAGVGSDSTSTIVGTTDWRGQTVVVALSFDGTTVKLFAGTAEEYSAAQTSTPTTTIPFRIGALNNNGTAGSFCGHYIKRLLVGRTALTLAQFLSIRSQLLAGA